jgi:ribonuclease P protein component
MLLKKNRVNKKDIDYIFKNGKFINSPFFTFKFVKSSNLRDLPRISFIISKSILKLAVKRNSLRRKGYNILRKYIKDFPIGLIGVFIFKNKEIDNITIENEIKNIVSKVN